MAYMHRASATTAAEQNWADLPCQYIYRKQQSVLMPVQPTERIQTPPQSAKGSKIESTWKHDLFLYHPIYSSYVAVHHRNTLSCKINSNNKVPGWFPQLYPYQ